MTQFKVDLLRELVKNRYNHFGRENFDENRFGRLYKTNLSNCINSLKTLVKRTLKYDNLSKNGKTFDDYIKESSGAIEKYYAGLDDLYKKLTQDDRNLVVKLIAFRIMGFTKVKLPSNNKQYHDGLKNVRNLKYKNFAYNPHFLHFVLNKYNLRQIGYEIDIIFGDIGIVVDFIIEQYAYRNREEVLVAVGEGDTVLDVGGCWGDTALYFAAKAGSTGKVYSFEFVPNNIKLFNINKGLNPGLENRIQLISHPISNTSEEMIYFKDMGPSSKIESQPFEGQTGTVTTLSIDDFVEKNDIERVDFIKMDIEGAEPMALEGAIRTIKKHRPKLAIATYHSMEDFVNIPKWILDLNLGYEIFIGHYTIHVEETVCFARVKD